MDGLRKGFVVGFCCVVLTVAVFALALAGATDNTLYLPAVLGPGSSSAPVDGTLENGGVVEGPDGVGLGALDDTLEAPIEVTIAPTTQPATPLPAMAQAISNYYLLGAAETVLVSPQQPLLVAFPVPPGADTAHLVLAKLVSGAGVHDANDGQESWLFLEGFYDPSDNLFLTTLGGLTGDGHTFVLTTHPDFESPSNSAPASANPGVSLIQAKCVHFSAPSPCTSSIEEQMEVFVTNVYGHIKQNKEFPDPRLRYLHETLDYNPNSLSSLGYMMYIEPHDSGWCDRLEALGYYDPAEGYMVLCYNPLQGIDDDVLSALVHEYFHATQYAYQPILEDWEQGNEEAWVVEGMAKGTEKSYTINEMRRSEAGGWVELHLVDQTLKEGSDNIPYFAQDFWVYHGLNNDLDLKYLRDILTEGSEAVDVASALGDGQRLPPYWEWAKNQVMEKQETFNNRLQRPCWIEPNLVQNMEFFEHHNPDKLQHQVTVGPLSTAVVKLTYSQDWGFAAAEVYPHLVAQLPEAQQALRYKFYEDGVTGCESIPDGPRTWPWGEGVYAARDYYVLISNIDIEKTFDYTIIIEFGN
jgi:hypothetical protein